MKRPALIPLCALLAACDRFELVGLEANLAPALNITVNVQEDTMVAVFIVAR
ncbi:MAG: hypothetical protein ACT4P6_15180 [Gemmatimonadaceae bacterium]